MDRRAHLDGRAPRRGRRAVATGLVGLLALLSVVLAGPAHAGTVRAAPHLGGPGPHRHAAHLLSATAAATVEPAGASHDLPAVTVARAATRPARGATAAATSTDRAGTGAVDAPRTRGPPVA